ncbi:MAG: iron-containing alcohol dehydrogenase [Gammaproteobacteria bacterium]|nr:iron-containing alcohol dehydrogenase [Gammaproteobacteria bacterium]
MPAFSLSRLPQIIFGAGRFKETADLVASFGMRALVVTGAHSLQCTIHWHSLTEALKQSGISWEHITVAGEPSPAFVDQAVRDLREARIEVVLGVGGGSVLDGAKAIAGLLRVDHSVMDYLEGVGPELPYQGPALPFIAAPTTAGTGSEATKNAVLSQPGKQGFKKSFRHELLVPRYAVVDPELLATCPPELIAANGMDALTQLIESYVSLKANPFTDALAWSGIEAARDGLLPWYEQGGAQSRNMAYAALLSGITLAQVGLGSVHGLASPLGAFFPIPHGVVCGTLVAAASEINIRALQSREPEHPALIKYARLGELLTRNEYSNTIVACNALIKILTDWTERLSLPPLRNYGVTTADVEHIVKHSRGSSMKTNPIVLTDEEVGEILQMRL